MGRVSGRDECAEERAATRGDERAGKGKAGVQRELESVLEVLGETGVKIGLW